MNARNVIVVLGLVAALGIGLLAGFVLGVASTKSGEAFFSDLFADEKPANISQPKEISRKGFKLKYPANWKIDKDDKDYDPDYFFSLESPGGCIAIFVLYDEASEPKQNITYQLDEFSKLVKGKVRKTTFENWGRYTGEGVDLRGRVLLSPGNVRIFSCSLKSRSFVVIEQYYDADLEKVQPGFELVRSSFVLKE